MEILVLSTRHKGIPPVALARSPSSRTAYHYDPSKPVPKSLVAMDQRASGVYPLRKRIASALILDAQQGAWVLRRSVFEPILSELSDVKMVPIEARDARGLIDDDWLLAHVTAVVPVDRKASKFGPHPEGGTPKRHPIALGWRQPPSSPLFRLKEHPWITCATRAVFDRLHRASKRAIVEATPPYSHYQPAFYPLSF